MASSTLGKSRRRERGKNEREKGERGRERGAHRRCALCSLEKNREKPKNRSGLAFYLTNLSLNNSITFEFYITQVCSIKVFTNSKLKKRRKFPRRKHEKRLRNHTEVQENMAPAGEQKLGAESPAGCS